MKKLLLIVVVLLMAAPLYAENEIRFSFVDNWDGSCTITYDVNEVAADPCDDPPVRPVAMGLTVEVTSGAPITSVILEDNDPCGFFEIFMDAAYSMELDPCDPCGYQYGAGTAIAFFDVPGEAVLALPWDPEDPCTVTANDGMKFAISMGGLGGETDPDQKSPPTSGSITLTSDGGSEFKLYVNAVRGGIIGEDGEPMVVLGLDDGGAKKPKKKISECYNEVDKRRKNPTPPAGKGTSWYNSGKPVCWCFPRQCHGDADGFKVGTPLGYKWVETSDGDIVSQAWFVKEGGNQSLPDYINVVHAASGRELTCGDAMHNIVGNPLGYKRVENSDGDEISAHWMCKEDATGTTGTAGVKKPNQPTLTLALPDCIPNSTMIHPCTGQPDDGTFSGLKSDCP